MLIKRPDDLRDKIMKLEQHVIDHMPPAKIKWVHRFAPGIYSREMIVPEGTMITGAIHKTEHISIFLEGEMYIPDGKGGSKVISAPLTEIGQPGAKRAGVTITECRWITFHPTDLETVEECEEAFFTNNPEEVPEHEPTAREFEQEDYALAQRKQLEGKKNKWLPSTTKTITHDED